MVNTPIPHSLRSEAKKAAKILKGFTVPSAKVGPDKLIPAGILLKAKGLAILTVVKAGFLVTARGGSGIVIAKVGDDLDAEWSAPSAIGIAGLGGGFEVGAEVTDFVIILTSRGAVEAFSKGGNLTLGGNFSIAAGPLGRNLEADVAVRSPAAIYTYSKTKGLFAGISIEGSGLIERKDANKKFYGQDIRAYQILSGEVPRPEECAALYDVLEMHRKRAEKQILDMAKKAAHKHTQSMGDKIKGRFSSKSVRDKESSRSQSSFYDDDSEDSNDDSMAKYSLPKSKTRSQYTEDDGSSHDPMSKYSLPSYDDDQSMSKYSMPKTHEARSHSFHSVSRVTQHSTTSSRGTKTVVQRSVKTHSTKAVTGSHLPDDPWAKVSASPKKAIANFSYEAQLPCDISFRKGEEIMVLTRTSSTNDWWEGMCRGHTGIFPANYVTVK